MQLAYMQIHCKATFRTVKVHIRHPITLLQCAFGDIAGCAAFDQVTRIARLAPVW